MDRIPYTGIVFMLLMNFQAASAQFISEVVGYTPAPGQFINTAPWGVPSSARSIEGTINGSLCLGSFGGFVIFRFESPVENHPENPYGVDFTIFGNPLPDWAEPGIVWVMKDENGNGAPDDSWYELAGSDYFFSSSIRNVEVTYINTGVSEASNVPWSDNAGKSGTIFANGIHLQPYYPTQDSFPSVPENEFTLSGSSIEAVLELNNATGIISKKRAFGYADNSLRGLPSTILPDNPYTSDIENSGGDAFDIAWAVDQEGNYVDLDEIHFVKVQSAIHNHGDFLGELSTELTGAVDVAPEGSIRGEVDMIVIRDLPPEIVVPTLQLEAFVFHHGRIQPDRSIHWSSNMAGATISQEQLLSVHEAGRLVLTASLPDRPEIRTTVSTTITLDETAAKQPSEDSPRLQLSPNPAGDFTRLIGLEEAAVSLFDAAGKCCLRIDSYANDQKLELTGLGSGWYLLKIDRENRVDWLRFVKR